MPWTARLITWPDAIEPRARRLERVEALVTARYFSG